MTTVDRQNPFLSVVAKQLETTSGEIHDLYASLVAPYNNMSLEEFKKHINIKKTLYYQKYEMSGVERDLEKSLIFFQCIAICIALHEYLSLPQTV